MRLTAIALSTALVVTCSCGDEVSDHLTTDHPAPSFNSVQLDLTLPRDELLNDVTYSVQKPGLSRSARVEVADSRQLRFRFGGLPADQEYTFSLAGTTQAGRPCLALAGFDVTPASLTRLALERTCNPKAAAQSRATTVRVTVQVDQQSAQIRCAAVSGTSGVPLAVSVGEPIQVEGYTTSPTAVRWRSDAGEFADPGAANTIFVCRVPGTHELRFEAALPAVCPPSVGAMEVSCAPRDTCGNGERDVWEECDDGNDSVGDGCTPACMREPFCIAGFPCALTGTLAFCTGRTRYQRARTAPCAEVCDSPFCTGASCTVTGEPSECPAGQECVMDSAPGSYTARCRRPR